MQPYEHSVSVFVGFFSPLSINEVKEEFAKARWPFAELFNGNCFSYINVRQKNTSIKDSLKLLAKGYLHLENR